MQYMLCIFWQSSCERVVRVFNLCLMAGKSMDVSLLPKAVETNAPSRDRHSALKDEKYSWSSRSERTIVSHPSESSLYGLCTADNGLYKSFSHQNLNTPSAWEAMYKLADARIAEAAADHERMKVSRLKEECSEDSECT